MAKYFTSYAVHYPTGDKGSVCIPACHLTDAIEGVFSYHVGYFWGLVIFPMLRHRGRGRRFLVEAFDLRDSSSRLDFQERYNKRDPRSLVTGRNTFLLFV